MTKEELQDFMRLLNKLCHNFTTQADGNRHWTVHEEELKNHEID